MHFTKRERLGIFLVLIIGGLGLGSWTAFFSETIISGVSDAWKPAPWFILLIIFFFLGAVVWTRTPLRMAGAALAFLPAG
jgi:hypothetical protein